MKTFKRLSSAATAVLLLTACQETLQERCQRECETYTRKNCPARIDATTLIDSLTFESATETIHYWYTLCGRADSVGLLSRKTVRQLLVTQLRNTTSMRGYMEAGYNFAYTYHSESRPQLVLFEEKLTADDYGADRQQE